MKLFIVKAVSNFYLSQQLNTRNSTKKDGNGVSLVSTVAFIFCSLYLSLF